MNRTAYLLFLAALLIGTAAAENGSRAKGRALPLESMECDVLVVGGGSGGITAGIQSARSGAKAIVVEPTPWLGGMLSAAGVSATDGDHMLPSGLWQEFREGIYQRYGGPKEVQTGWVSYTLFEPHVADSIFKAMASREKNLTIVYKYRFMQVLLQGKKATGAVFANDEGKQLAVRAKMVIDATELGDVLKDAGAGYDVGMESKAATGEACALDSAYGFIQDITYAAILKEYGPGTDMTIPKPASYDSTKFLSACKSWAFPDAESNSRQMLEYGRMPNNKYLINWWIGGNDYYVNAIEMSYADREKAYEKAKEKTLCFIYYMQHNLGYTTLGLADDEFPTADKLPLIPYNREGRRVKGIVRFTVNDILQPHTRKEQVFRTSISVGDYPIDQHINENYVIPNRDFPPIPSFGIPLGCLIPEQVDGLIAAEKSISVSNIVNGATRLQPCVMLTGQAAGILASLCAAQNIQPRDAGVREIQKRLLESHAYLMPFIDVVPADPNFMAVQRIGATGILQGVGVSYNWENQTWFYPSRPISKYELVQGLKQYYPKFEKFNDAPGDDLDIATLIAYMAMAGTAVPLEQVKKDWELFCLPASFSDTMKLDRRMTAVLIDHYLKPFDRAVDLHGKLL